MTKETITKSIMTRTGLIMILVSGASFVAVPSVAHAETSKEISAKKDGVESEIEVFEKNLERTEKKIARKTKEFDKTEQEIKDVSEIITETEERLEARQEIISNRLTAYQTNDTGGMNIYLKAIFGSDSISDLIGRVSMAGTIIDADASIMDSQEKDRIELESQRGTLVHKKLELEKQFQELQEAFVNLETKKNEMELLSTTLGENFKDALDKEERVKREKQRKKEEERIKNLQELQQLSFEKTTGSLDLPSNVKATKKGSMAIKEASKHLGGKYVWGGANPKTSFDCSGYTQWSFGKAGIDIPRTAAQQYLHTDKISASELRAGDLVFFSYGQGISHVGIYIGDGKMMNAQNSGIMVAELSGYWTQYIAGYGRVPGA